MEKLTIRLSDIYITVLNEQVAVYNKYTDKFLGCTSINNVNGKNKDDLITIEHRG